MVPLQNFENIPILSSMNRNIRFYCSQAIALYGIPMGSFDLDRVSNFS